MCTVTLRITTIPCRLYLQQADGVWEGRGGGGGLNSRWVSCGVECEQSMISLQEMAEF